MWNILALPAVFFESMKRSLLLFICFFVLAAAPAFAVAASGSEPSHRVKAVQYQTRGLLARAVAEYRLAIEENPDDAASYNNAALALKDMDLLDDAEAQERAAIELKPNNANYHYNLGIIKMRQSKLAEAEGEFRRAVELNAKDPEFAFRLAQVLMLESRNDEAEHSIRAALALKDSNPTYNQLLGDILLRQIRTDEALVSYKRARDLSPKKDDQLENKIEYAADLLSARQTGPTRAPDLVGGRLPSPNSAPCPQ